MKLNWVAAALSIGAAGTDSAVALASAVPDTLAGVKVSLLPFLHLISALSPYRPCSLRRYAPNLDHFLPCSIVSFLTIFPPQLSAPLAYTKPRDSLSLSFSTSSCFSSVHLRGPSSSASRPPNLGAIDRSNLVRINFSIRNAYL